MKLVPMQRSFQALYNDFIFKILPIFTAIQSQIQHDNTESPSNGLLINKFINYHPAERFIYNCYICILRAIITGSKNGDKIPGLCSAEEQIASMFRHLKTCNTNFFSRLR